MTRTGDATPARRVLLFHVGDQPVAVDFAEAVEVVVAPVVTRLPTAPAAVLGAFNLRGDLVPLYDTAALLGLPGTGGDYAVVVESGRGLAALAAWGSPSTQGLTRLAGPGTRPGTLGTFALEAEAVASSSAAEGPLPPPLAVCLLDAAALFAAVGATPGALRP